MSHVTGGGLAANLERVLPGEVTATIDRATWTPHPVFDLVREVGGVPQADLEQTLNCGVGMVALVDADDADRVLATLAEHGVEAWVCGEVTAGRRARPGGRGLAGGARTPAGECRGVSEFADGSVREQPRQQVALSARERPIRPGSPGTSRDPGQVRGGRPYGARPSEG